MNLFRSLSDSSIRTPTVLTFGAYDGLHLGHQLIMRKVVEQSLAIGFASTVLTFDPHPRAVLKPGTSPPLLQTLEQKAETLEKLGIEQTIVLTFTSELSHVPAEAFLRDTVFGRLDAREVHLGHGFAFGHNREGRFELLKQMADELGRIACEEPEVRMRGHRISSTMIRRLLSTGRVNIARSMLGQPYCIRGQVVRGRGVGKPVLNYATANLRSENFVTPAAGVYMTIAQFRGVRLPALTNIGHRPTFESGREMSIETHIIGIDEELYGVDLELCFLHRLRNEMKFESVDQLRNQIGRDYTSAGQYFRHSTVRRAYNL